MDDAGDDAGPYGPRFAELRDAPTALIECIDELALDVLQDAAGAGHRTRPELERRLTRARNGLERVGRHLAGDARTDADTGGA